MAAGCALRELKLARVIFIPAALPPHKEAAELACPRHRLNMVRIAVRGNRRFSVSSVEMRRPGPSYTIDTASQIAAKFPRRSLVFIVGADTVPEIPTWRRYRKLLGMVRFAVLPRRGYRQTALRGYRDRFLLLRSPSVPISSCAIRRMIRKGNSVSSRYLPGPVAAYISRAGLYGSGKRAPLARRRR